MNNIIIKNSTDAITIIIESEAYEGVRRIADRVSEDIELVTGYRPPVYPSYSNTNSTVVVCGTPGCSPILDRLAEEGRLPLDKISGKREVYLISLLSEPFHDNPDIKQALIIAGSDKRGTIYGLFHLSEMCGVSPLVFWGDVAPAKNPELILELNDTYISKEPSVRYRGFFINDEWPAFGRWCTEKYGGVNAKAYNEVFIFLLRLKGNYMWPAMWRSVFSEEGPGLASAELADIYGVIIGLSHHEPMCRAGAEWQRIYDRYGDDNTWSFITNSEAITKFWEDGIIRNRPYENLITIGMRGEDDSKLLPEDSTIEDNINVVKNAILTQHRLIKEHINPNLSEVPRMLAIYKEVEDFYYGDGTCEGLKDWDELDDVILMLCEDNYGNTRGLPLPDDRPHPGGYGMYYHFDYHGAPVSYEWQNCSRLTRTREQMTCAYEHGIRELWIVNVGDIKGMEYPLSYFMALAYDYDKWSPVHAVTEFVHNWIHTQFGNRISDYRHEQLVTLLDGWTRWGAARRPEAMNAYVYNPCNYREGERVSMQINELVSVAEELHHTFPDELMDAYESIIYYPAIMTFNNILMCIDAGMNAHYAARGSLAANVYGRSVIRRLQADSKYTDLYHSIASGKWNHMMDSAHTGFRTWDDNDYVNPVIQTVFPIRGGKIVVGFRGSSEYHLGAHWQDTAPLFNDDMTRPDVNEVIIELDSRGDVSFEYNVTTDSSWLTVSPSSGRVEITDDVIYNNTSDRNNYRAILTLTSDKSVLKSEGTAYIDIAVTFDNGEKTSSRLMIAAGCNPEELTYPVGTYIEKQDYIAIDAAHYVENIMMHHEGFHIIPHLGRMGDALRAFPVTKSFMDCDKKPYVRYDFAASSSGKYIAELWLSPNNPRERGGHIRCLLSVNDSPARTVETVSEGLYTEWSCDEWNRGVMNNIRIIPVEIVVNKGYNRLYIYAGDPGIILERIILHREDRPLKDSYLGPVESYMVK